MRKQMKHMNHMLTIEFNYKYYLPGMQALQILHLMKLMVINDFMVQVVNLWEDRIDCFQKIQWFSKISVIALNYEKEFELLFKV